MHRQLNLVPQAISYVPLEAIVGVLLLLLGQVMGAAVASAVAVAVLVVEEAEGSGLEATSLADYTC
jgi:hypothetical protein